MATKVDDAKTAGKRKTLDAFFSVTRQKKAKPADTKGKQAMDGKAPLEQAAEPSAITTKPSGSSSSAVAAESSGSSSSVMALDPEEYHLDPEEYRLELETIDPSWLKYLRGDLAKASFRQLKRFLREEHAKGKKIFPPAPDVYSWSRFTPLGSLKVVVLGQDPYHGDGQAHGLAFSVRPGVRVPPSLANMYKALADDVPGFERPPHGFLVGWAKQGVLLLNATLTVEAHKANSHAARGWQEFTDAVIRVISQHCQNVVFMLWGANAQKKGAQVDRAKNLVLTSVHPSPLSARRGFFDAHHFRKANQYLEEHGIAPIDWACLPADSK